MRRVAVSAALCGLVMAVASGAEAGSRHNAFHDLHAECIVRGGTPHHVYDSPRRRCLKPKRPASYLDTPAGRRAFQRQRYGSN